jgi:hypothetical protein
LERIVTAHTTGEGEVVWGTDLSPDQSLFPSASRSLSAIEPNPPASWASCRAE